MQDERQVTPATVTPLLGRHTQQLTRKQSVTARKAGIGFVATLWSASTPTITAAGNGVPHRWSTTFSRQQSDSELGYNTQNRVLLKWHIPFSMAEDGSHDEFTDAGNQSSGHTDGSPFAALPQHVRVSFPRSICHF